MLLSMQNIVNSLQARTGVPFAIGLPDGSRYRAGLGEPAFTVLFRSDAARLSAFTRGHMGLLESYFDQSVDVESDLAAALAAGLLSGLDMHAKALNSVEYGIHELRYSNHSLAQAKTNARAHYGLGAEFYRLWLDDPLMIYTCAYWPEGTQTLEQAQARKIDHVCRKIRLSRGETFIDIGCGFGGFIFRAWETLGALGAGLNITTEQVDWLSSEITRRGFADKFSAREADFRDVDDQYDKVASIGVLEHAGRDQRAAVVHSCDAKQSSGLIILPFATWQRMKCATVQIA